MDMASGPRLLLRRLHRVMAGSGTVEARLNQLVQEIARNMVAEVCSVYVSGPDDYLELVATEGLKQEAVHKSRLKVGEGLVGHIAQSGVPLNLMEARDHPKFVYLPETGEEIYHSLLGVPVIRAGQVAGVLVVQNQMPRAYDNEEVEVLQTIAMVLAELIGRDGLVRGPVEPGDAPGTITLEGQVLVEGLGAGQVFYHEPQLEITNHVADDIGVERQRLDEALVRLRSELDQMIAATDMVVAGEYMEIIDTYRMFARDRGWQERIVEAIESGLTAEAAVERIQQDIRSRMAETTDNYLKERLADLEDLSNRLIRTLLGFSGREAHHQLTSNVVVIARNMGPAELLDYDRAHLKAIILEEGSPTAHVTIVARALGVPVLGRATRALQRLREGMYVIVDAEAGRAIAEPSDDIRAAYRESIQTRQALTEAYATERNLPPVTRDGVNIELLMNAGLVIDLPNLEATGAQGIGLFRTEFQFMISATLPRLEVQVLHYRTVLEAAGDLPVVFRTLDIGGDKRVPFLTHEDEENPALGWRAIRLALGRPGLLRYQVRALLTATQGRVLNLMFPMIAEVAEFKEAKALVEFEARRMRRLGHPMPSEMRIGTMLEVPALAWQMDSLLKETDFVSIGTNDLLQFFFASDRSNPRLVDRYDLISPPVLSFIRSVVGECKKAGVPVTVCGELAGRPLEALALLGLGLTSLSLSASAIGPVRRLVRSLDIAAFEDWLLPHLGSDVHSLRPALEKYAEQENLTL